MATQTIGAGSQIYALRAAGSKNITRQHATVSLIMKDSRSSKLYAVTSAQAFKRDREHKRQEKRSSEVSAVMKDNIVEENEGKPQHQIDPIWTSAKETEHIVGYRVKGIHKKDKGAPWVDIAAIELINQSGHEKTNSWAAEEKHLQAFKGEIGDEVKNVAVIMQRVSPEGYMNGFICPQDYTTGYLFMVTCTQKDSFDETGDIGAMIVDVPNVKTKNDVTFVYGFVYDTFLSGIDKTRFAMCVRADACFQMLNKEIDINLQFPMENVAEPASRNIECEMTLHNTGKLISLITFEYLKLI